MLANRLCKLSDKRLLTILVGQVTMRTNMTYYHGRDYDIRYFNSHAFGGRRLTNCYHIRNTYEFILTIYYTNSYTISIWGGGTMKVKV